MILFQITLNKLATQFVFESDKKIALVHKMVELQQEFPQSEISFLKIEL